MLDGGNFILMCSGNERNSFGKPFMINSKYKQAIMNFEAVDDRICLFRIRGKFSNVTIKSVAATTEKSTRKLREL